MHKLIFGVALSTLLCGTALAGTPGWRVSESSGGVFVVHQGLSKAATGGADVAVGDVISTARDGRAVLVRGQEYLVVSPNSRLKVVEPGASGGVTQIFEELGNVVFKIEKKSTPHFGVQTPYLAAVVKGTTFSVTVTDAGAAVQVTEGRVEVSSLDGGATQMLTPGMIGMVSRDQPQQLTIDQGQTPAPDAGVAIDAPATATASSADVGSGPSAQVAASSIAASVATSASPSAGQGASQVAGQVAGMSGVDPGLVAADASRVSLIAKNGNGYAYGQAVAASVSKAGGNGNGVANGLIDGVGNGGSNNAGGNGAGVANGLADGIGSVASNNAGGDGNGVANGLINGVGNGGSSNAGGNGAGVANGLADGIGSVASNNAGGNGNGVANGLTDATGAPGTSNAGGNGNGVANGLTDAAGGSGSSNAGGNGVGVAKGLVDSTADAVAQMAASVNGLGVGKKN